MIEFEDVIFEQDVVVHCPEEWMADNLLRFARSKGYKWNDGSEYDKSFHDNFKHKTCYILYDGFHMSTDDISYESHTILNYYDVAIKEGEIMTEFKDIIFESNVAIHCPEEWMANELLKYADSKGYDWSTGESYLNFNCWRLERQNTVYFLETGEYSSIDYARKGNYEILHYNDVVIKEGLNIKIKPLSNKFKMPVKGDKDSACYDCYATSVKIDNETGVLDYGLGFACEPPKGYSIQLYPRSSVYRTGLRMCNSIGIIDSSYRGELIVKFYTDGADENIYSVGDRVCQMKLIKDIDENLVIVDELSATPRGDGGFGSTGLR